MNIALLIIVGLLGLWLLPKIFWALLEIALSVTLLVWILMLVTGFVLFVVVPMYCGITDQDPGLVIQHILHIR